MKKLTCFFSVLLSLVVLGAILSGSAFAAGEGKLDEEALAALFAGSKAWDEEAQAIYDDTVENGVLLVGHKWSHKKATTNSIVQTRIGKDRDIRIFSCSKFTY